MSQLDSVFQSQPPCIHELAKVIRERLAVIEPEINQLLDHQGPASVSRLFASVPVETCLDLSEAWMAADTAGAAADQLRTHLAGPELQLIELVVSMYAGVVRNGTMAGVEMSDLLDYECQNDMTLATTEVTTSEAA